MPVQSAALRRYPGWCVAVCERRARSLRELWTDSLICEETRLASTPMLSAQRERERRAAASSGARYQQLERLGAGGMGVVYRVLDRVTGEERALKRASSGALGARNVAAFEREYQTLASLDHPRIIRVFDYGVDEQGPYYTMELLEGQDMRRAAPLPFKQACLCLRDVATSLAILHARGLIHRDVSPGNVRMSSDGRCKLLDFGALAAFGSNPVIVGTPPMIAPEVLAGGVLDQRVDLFALGALAYWMLTGMYPYPARELGELHPLWQLGIVPPSHYVPEIPPVLDALVLWLLQLNPLARPESASEVIAQLELIGELPPEVLADTQRLAHSFLLRPRFIGRSMELRHLNSVLQRCTQGSGAAVRILSGPGGGRSRLLDELGLRAKLAGALVLRADASMARQLNGVTRALVQRLYEGAPELTRSLANEHRGALNALGSDIAERCGLPPLAAAPSGTGQIKPEHDIESLFEEVARHRPLLLAIDDIDYADDASVGMLAALADRCEQHAIMIAVSEIELPEKQVGLGLAALQRRSRALQLASFTQAETDELVRSAFGGAPNAERFSSWLHGRTAGIPLYVIELCRQLIDKGIIRYAGGVWTLPVERPDEHVPEALGDAMTLRLTSLSEPARALAECLSLQQSPPTRELCQLLVHDTQPGKLLDLLAELLRRDVLTTSEGELSFSSNALRQTLLSSMDDLRRRQNHRRLGEALATLSEQGPAVRLRAGWHLIQGEDSVRGADMIAAVAADGVSFLKLSVNLHRNASIIEAALAVYARQRYSLYRRLPLLAMLAYCGYYEDRVWGERYGDQALDALEDLSGLRTARRLRPWLGGWLSALVGLAFAYLRFVTTPKVDRPYTFFRLFVQLCTAVTSLAGTAALSLDSERTARVAATLEPYSRLPQRMSFVGVYQFCRSLEQIGLENQPQASATFGTLLARFQNPKYYPSMQGESRGLCIAPLWFARGAFATFKGDGTLALRCADELDALGFKLYSMIASQLRYLYYMFRGETAKAAPHHAQVEMYAAQVGSAWQVETWECPAMILLYTYTLDTVAATRLVHRLETLSKSVPALRRYQRLALHALMIARGAALYVEKLMPEYVDLPPRSYIGWSASLAYFARGLNDIGKYEQAKRVCEDALAQLSDAHRDYVTLFLTLDLQLAVADAGLKDYARALGRIDGLLTRFAACDHPLLQGSLHEARARICWAAGDTAGYQRSLTLVDFHFGATATPALIAKCEQLAQLGRAPAAAENRHSARAALRTLNQAAAANDAQDEHVATQTNVWPERDS